MVVVSAGHEYVDGTRDSGIVFSATAVLGMNMVRGMRGVGVVCEMCMCLVRVGVVGEWIRGLGLGFTNPVGTGGVLEVCLFLGCGGVCGEWVERRYQSMYQGLKVRVVYVCVGCESGLFVYMAGPGIYMLC